MRQAVTQPVLPVFSDLHVRAENLRITMGVVASMRAEAQALGVREIGFLGDWWHRRGLLPVVVLNAIVDELDRWAQQGLTLIMIPGNHDQEDHVHGRNALEVFRSHPACRLYDKPTLDQHGLWVPFRELDEVRRILKHFGPQPRLLWHGPVLGSLMNDTCLSESGLRQEEFETYGLAVFGHHHKRQKVGKNAYYAGSPFETRADERNQAKGFAVLRGLTLEYQNRVWGPQHRTVTGESAEHVEVALQGASSSDIVRVRVPEQDVERVSKMLHGRFADLVVTPVEVRGANVRPLVGEAFSISDHARRYVREKAPERETELMRVFEELTA